MTVVELWQARRFDVDCMKERGRILTGRFAHYCIDWDGLTVDETCIEANSCNDMTYDESAKAETAKAVKEFEESDPSFYALNVLQNLMSR